MMPKQKPGRSKQDYGTPWELIRAVEARWGKLAVDLAANVEGDNAKAPRCLSYASDTDNSLTAHWWESFSHDLCWLNPPFADIGAWTKKCRDESAKGARILMLVPASIGSEWFARDVFPTAGIIGLRPRITFEGCKDPYPKDCMLLLWNVGEFGFGIWRWKP